MGTSDGGVFVEVAGDDPADSVEAGVGQASPTAHPTAPIPTVRLLEADLRKVVATTWAGAVAGFVVLGWGSRLAMMLLARLNPAATGRISDDGFVMGRFDLGNTMGLVLFCTVVGMIGGMLFLVLRQLRFGPPWFRTWSMVVGPAVVGGSLLVHTDGIDFRILEPTWLAIALFVILPGAFAGAVAWLADRWTAEGTWFRTGSPRRLLGLAVLVPVIFLGLPLVLALGVHTWWQRSERFRAIATVDGLHAAARVLLVLAFAGALFDLARKSVELL